MKLKLTFLLLLLVICPFIGLAANQPPSHPNIILIMIDDVGADWIGCYGAEQKTPQIDRLAEQGARFETAWATPLCSPTRVELLTGRYAFRTGWTKHHDVPRWGGKGLDWEREKTFARFLRDAGYATAIAGKWQINDLRKYEALKLHGFDEHCVWTGYETGNAPPSDERYWNAYLQTNGKREICTNRFGPDVVNEFTLDFVRRHQDQPFLLYYPMILCHSPYPSTPFNKSNPPHDMRQLYSDLVTYVDYLVGKIVLEVDELGLAGHTMIIVTGDNGSSTGGIRNGIKYPAGKNKITNWGLEVPFVVRAPWLGKAGRVISTPTDFSDVLPTLLDVAGISMPKGETIDGHSLVPLLKDRATPGQKRTWIFSEIGDKRTVRDERFKLDNSGRFWDVKSDPLEQHDLSQSDATEVVGERKKLLAVLESLPADGPPPFPRFLHIPESAKKKKK